MNQSEKRDNVKVNANDIHQWGVAEIHHLLESNNENVFDDVKLSIHEQLTNTKDAWLLHCLVDCYIATQSLRCLEVIVGIREPHDKHLFDKLADCLKGGARYNALLLISHLVRKHPSWLYKIAQHRVMNTLLHILKTDTAMTNLMSAVLIVASLLPVIPSLVGSHLPDIFESFSRLAAWNIKKSGNVPEVYIIHLQVGVYALFHRLYAMYPCNFLAYLRSYYGRRDQNQESVFVFKETIKPMLERVRLHPLLVTASKETELTTTRWKKMEIHDIMMECAKVSLDVIEGTCEDVPCGSFWNTRPFQIASGRHFSSLSFKENCRSVLNPSSPRSLVKDALVKSQIMSSSDIWSPSIICERKTPSPTNSSSSSNNNSITAVDGHTDQECTGQVICSPSSTKINEILPLDVAVEAKPEESSIIDSLETSVSTVPSVQEEINVPMHSSEEIYSYVETHSLDNSQSEEQLTPAGESSKSSLPDISQAEEAKEDGHPPADEMSILRGQILLLHNQLLFERHKREIHAERNRRLLGKAKRAWMLEEQNAAMKDQLQLQEKEIQDLVKEVNRLSKMCNKWKDVKNHQNEEINKKLRTLTDENTNLEQKKTRTYEQLIEQKQENELLRSELRKVCSQYSEIQLELASAFRRANRCQKLEEDAKRLSKEVILLSEMNQHYRERIENMQPLPTVSAEDAMWRQSAISEISALKQKLESKTILLEATKERIMQLESIIAHNNSIMTEQKQLLELTKSCHIDILQAKESKISALQKIWRQQEMYILELQQKLQLSEMEILTLGNKKSLSRDKIINQSTTPEVSLNADETDDETYSKVNNTTLNESDYLISSEMLTTPDRHSLNASNFINQCQVTYKSLENCVNESLENNGTSQTQSLPTSSNGCTLEEIK